MEEKELSELEEFKEQVNYSLDELVNLILDLQRQQELLEQRIANFNARSSHRI